MTAAPSEVFTSHLGDIVAFRNRDGEIDIRVCLHRHPWLRRFIERAISFAVWFVLPGACWAGLVIGLCWLIGVSL